jgi:tetratricopeptide (TPR) repeat protein
LLKHLKRVCDYDAPMKFPLFLRFPSKLWLSLALTLASASPLLAQAQKNADANPPDNSGMSGELLYEILLGELNARQGEPGAAFSLILDAARKSNDTQLFSRAVDIALQSRSGEGALVAARAWSKAAPQDRRANNHLFQILVALNQVGESLEPLKKDLSLAPESERLVVISLIPRHYSRVSDKKLAASVVQQALEPYTKKANTAAAAWASVGRMHVASDNTSVALEAAQKGLAADGKALAPALLALELMSRNIPEAEALVTQALRNQDSLELGMNYVQVLVEAQRYPDATEQLQRIIRTYPKRAEPWLILGSIQFELSQDKQAEASLSRYIELASLSTASERDNDRGISQAQSRRATILARQGKLKEARQLLQSLPAKTADQQRGRVMAEVQLLREHRQWQAAFDLLATVNAEGDSDLLYEQAMLAEKLGKLDDMERLLRNLIAKDPSYYNAYNALGFSLADRNLRLTEAKQLIIKALTFAPDDPFITDSLGWVEFRLGNLNGALGILEKAYKARKDAEIAAHLGEVLWQLKRTDDAVKIWREGLEIAPNNETLQETLKRIKPAL